jgi:hypothetical protein
VSLDIDILEELHEPICTKKPLTFAPGCLGELPLFGAGKGVFFYR